MVWEQALGRIVLLAVCQVVLAVMMSAQGGVSLAKEVCENLNFHIRMI